MDKRVKILLMVFGALVFISGGFYGYMRMTAKEEAETVVAAPPVKESPPPAPPAPVPAEPAPSAPEAGQPAQAPVQGQPAPAPVPAPAQAGGQPAPPVPPPPPVPAPAPYEPVIKAAEKGKEVQYKTPEEFLAKTALTPDEVKALSAKMTADSEKALADPNVKKDKQAAEKAGKDADLAGRLAKLVSDKFPAQAKPAARVYASLGKRDPFMSPLEVPKVYPKVPATASPLERFPADKFSVKAVMWSAKGYRALVVTPDGLGFTVKVGDALGDKKGRIDKITEKRVYVVEKITDILGDVETRKIVLNLQ